MTKKDEVPPGTIREFQIDGKTFAVSNVDGKLYAINNLCLHRGGPLGQGELKGNVVTCPWHAWRFRLADGAWADNPRIKIGCYAVRVEGDTVQVQAPDPPLKPKPGVAP